MKPAQPRQAVIDTALAMNAIGLNHGAAGNVSARAKDGFLITPSGAEYADLRPADVVLVAMDGTPTPGLKPSSEWRFHRDLYAADPSRMAIVHVHSSFATTLACLGRGIPAFHYMVAVAGGRDIRCAPYATFGSAELSTHAVAAMAGRKACLLGHHGMIAAGRDLAEALAIAQEVENLARVYWQACQIADPPPILDDAEMERVLDKFSGYGRNAQNHGSQ